MTREHDGTCWMARSALKTAMVATVLLAGPSARADVVPPLPEDCPEGSLPSSCHGGEYCYPHTCAGGAGCSGGESCQQRQLCIGTINCAGGWSQDAAPVDTVEGTCEGGAACTEGTCQTVEVCVPTGGTGGTGGTSTGTGTGGSGATGATSPGPGPQEVEQGCGCRLPAQREARLPWAWPVLAAILFARRRRRSAASAADAVHR